MTVRRTNAPRKRAPRKKSGEKLAVISRDVTRGAAPYASELGDNDKPVEPDSDVILAEFEAALRENPLIDADGIDFALEQFRDAIRQASLQPKKTTPSKELWLETLALLSDNALIQEEDRATLSKVFNEHLGENSEGVQQALEFSRRLDEEGEAAALRWLQNRRFESSAASESASTTKPDTQAPRAEVPYGATAIKLKSRRLRGPPSGK